MDLNKVVAQFKDRTILKGKTFNFSPAKPNFHMETPDGRTLDVDFERLKAVFFVKTYDGDKNRHDNYTGFIPGGGKRIRVKFLDGETVSGFSQGFNHQRQGFFITPADPCCNNNRIFVITSAVEDIRLINSPAAVELTTPVFAL